MTAPTVPRATEAQCQATIIDFATRLGYLVHAERPAQTGRGRWLTNIQGHTGWPDLAIVHPYHRSLWLVELKRSPNKVEPAQTRWLDALGQFDDGWIRVRTIWVPEGMTAFLAELQETA